MSVPSGELREKEKEKEKEGGGRKRAGGYSGKPAFDRVGKRRRAFL